MKKEIVFQANVENPKPVEKSSFRSLIFRGDYFKRGVKIPAGTTWLRLISKIQGSSFPAVLPLSIYRDFGGVTFVSPTTFDTHAVDPVSQASQWLRKNKHPAGYNKETKQGFKLWPQTYGVAWTYNEAEETGKRLGLYMASLYDGIRGGTPGVFAKIGLLSEERDEEPGSATKGQLINGDVTHPETGKLVGITKTESGEYPSYAVKASKGEYPMSKVMAGLTEEEVNLIEPLERVIYVPTEQEIHGFLRPVIGEALHKEIFG